MEIKSQEMGYVKNIDKIYVFGGFLSNSTTLLDNLVVNVEIKFPMDRILDNTSKVTPNSRFKRGENIIELKILDIESVTVTKTITKMKISIRSSKYSFKKDLIL